jgi:hypothetical protein
MMVSQLPCDFLRRYIDIMNKPLFFLYRASPVNTKYNMMRRTYANRNILF